MIGKQSYDLLTEIEYPEIKVVVNDLTAYFVVTDIKADKSFGSNAFNVTGFSRSLLLSSPFSTEQSISFDNPLYAQQIANQFLPEGSGFTLEFSLENDWLIPGGTLNYSSITPISGITDIAKAGGGFVYSDLTTDTLTIKKRNKGYPWKFSTTVNDRILASSVILTKSTSHSVGKDYNRVWVSGTNSSGVLASVTREGTAGDIIASEIQTHAAITDVQAARQFGSEYLIENMSKDLVTISTPFSNDVPLFVPGELVKTIEKDSSWWQGSVDSVELSVGLSDRELKISQNISMEVYS